MTDDVAALMLTNPNTLGIFESQYQADLRTSCTPEAASCTWTGPT